MDIVTQPVAAAGFQPWPFWVAGTAIGVFVLVFRLVAGKRLGVATGYADACGIVTDPEARRSWRLPFIAGIVGGGALAGLATGALEPTWVMGQFDALVSASLPVKAVVFTFGGVLVGFGARLAGGCTSGHGIVGMAQLAPASIIATLAFMVSGFAVTNVLLRVLGG